MEELLRNVSRVFAVACVIVAILLAMEESDCLRRRIQALEVGNEAIRLLGI